MLGSGHYILKQIFEVELEQGSNTKLLSDRLGVLFESKIKKEFEKVLDKFDQKGQRISIDKISIELECDDLEDIEALLLRELPYELDKALQKTLPDTIQTSFQPERIEFLEILINYLEKGFFTWNAKEAVSLAELEYSLLESLDNQHNNALKFLLQLLQRPIRLHRFIQLFSAKTQQRFMEHLLPDIAEKWPAEHVLPALKAIFQYEVFWEVLLKQVQQPQPSIAALVKHLKSLQLENKWRSPSESNQIQDLPKGEKIIPKEGIFLHNAGVVLLNPFIPTLFSQLNIADKKQILLPEKAIQVLNYAVTGKDKFEEWDVPLLKVLCGIPIDQVIIFRENLQTEEITEIENILNALIGYWEILKNTQIDGLQDGFLQRYGRLSETTSSWKLRVEQKGIDVLLDHLPWTISYIQFPWMEKALITEWN